MSLTEMLFPSQDSPTGFPEPDSALVTLNSNIGSRVILCQFNLSQPSPKIVAAFPVGKVMDEDDPMHRVEEDMPGVALTVAASHIP